MRCSLINHPFWVPPLLEIPISREAPVSEAAPTSEAAAVSEAAAENVPEICSEAGRHGHWGDAVPDIPLWDFMGYPSPLER